MTKKAKIEIHGSFGGINTFISEYFSQLGVVEARFGESQHTERAIIFAPFDDAYLKGVMNGILDKIKDPETTIKKDSPLYKLKHFMERVDQGVDFRQIVLSEKDAPGLMLWFELLGGYLSNGTKKQGRIDRFKEVTDSFIASLCDELTSNGLMVYSIEDVDKDEGAAQGPAYVIRGDLDLAHNIIAQAVNEIEKQAKKIQKTHHNQRRDHIRIVQQQIRNNLHGHTPEQFIKINSKGDSIQMMWEMSSALEVFKRKHRFTSLTADIGSLGGVFKIGAIRDSLIRIFNVGKGSDDLKEALDRMGKIVRGDVYDNLSFVRKDRFQRLVSGLIKKQQIGALENVNDLADQITNLAEKYFHRPKSKRPSEPRQFEAITVPTRHC